MNVTRHVGSRLGVANTWPSTNLERAARAAAAWEVRPRARPTSKRAPRMGNSGTTTLRDRPSACLKPTQIEYESLRTLRGHRIIQRKCKQHENGYIAGDDSATSIAPGCCTDPDFVSDSLRMFTIAMHLVALEMRSLGMRRLGINFHARLRNHT